MFIFIYIYDMYSIVLMYAEFACLSLCIHMASLPVNFRDRVGEVETSSLYTCVGGVAHPKIAQQMDCFKRMAPQQKLSLQRYLP